MKITFAKVTIVCAMALFGGLLVSTPALAQELDPELAPFYHGVASGDPLSDAVIIWTRYTPTSGAPAAVEVSWMMGTDPDLNNVIQSGTFTTGPDRDYTVKLDVTGLEPYTTYYYAFEADGVRSVIGRTLTAPAGPVDQLRFAVTSCARYPSGYYNSYARIADREDLDAVIMLGDYIYEDGGGGIPERPHSLNSEAVSTDEYRARYSQYRLDPDLRRVHQMHPFIAVWDDHESANEAYRDGAGAHNPATEGPWEERKARAKKVYDEWIPVRPDVTQVPLFRKLSYGDLVDLFMLETRLEGRDITFIPGSPVSVDNPFMYDENRTMLGERQKAWLKDGLASSTAQWKVIGQQTAFGQLNTWWGGDPNNPLAPNATAAQNLFLDSWGGYPAERAELISFIGGLAGTNPIDNVVIVTGDAHTSYAFDLSLEPVALTGVNPAVPFVGQPPVPVTPTYDPASGAGSVAVEFVGPSISSDNFDEIVGLELAQLFQFAINNPLGLTGLPIPPELAELNPNPHLKHADLIQHGYFVIDLKADRAQANYYYIETRQEPNENESFGVGVGTDNGANRLTQGAESAGKPAKIERFYLTTSENSNVLLADLDGAVIDRSNLDDLAVNLQSITRPAQVGSVVLELSGPVNQRRVENEAPYFLFGNSTGSGSNRAKELPVGTYTLTATPYSEAGAMGMPGQSLTAQFEVIETPAPAPMIVGLQLTTSNNDEVVIDNLTDGTVINLDVVGDLAFNIKALTLPEETGSVAFELSGPIEEMSVENEVPYFLFGNNTDRTTNRARHLEVGSYTLRVTPFSEANGRGMAGQTQTIEFEVTENQAPVARFTTDRVLGIVPLMVSFDASASTDADGNIVAYRWDFGDGNTAEGVTVMNTFQAVGTYVVTLEVTDDLGATSTASETIVVEAPQDAVTALRLTGVNNDEVIVEQLTDGTTIDLGAIGNVPLNIEAVTDPPVVGSVVFEIDGPVRSRRTENIQPYYLFGDRVGTGSNNARQLPAGTYTLTATPYDEGNGRGTAGQPITVRFEVIEGTAFRQTAPAVSNQPVSAAIMDDGTKISLYPNPPITQSWVTLRVEGATSGKVFARVVDQMGRRVGILEFEKEGAIAEQRLDVRGLPSGTYYVQTLLNGLEGNARLMINK